MDYSVADASTTSFFASRPAAKAAVDAAAANLSSFITSTFSAISSSGTPNATNITGTNGATTATAEWGYSYNNPSTGVSTDITAPSVAANTVRVFFGMSSLTGSTLGNGGPAGTFLTVGASGFESQLVGAVNNMQAASNPYMLRNSSVIIDTYNDSLTLGSATAPYSLCYGPAYGSLSMDMDTNNDGSRDSLAQMDAYWHYDSTTPVTAGKYDFYSVALHELVHTLGLGASKSWDDNHTGTTWTGANAVALNGGSGAGLVSADGSHISQSIISTSLMTGTAQTALMAPSLSTGTRRQLTAMDAAMLQDMNYVVTVPEPGGALLISVSCVLVLARRRRPVAA